LEEKGEGLEDVRNVLKDLLEAVKDARDEEAVAAADMYGTLVEVLG